MINLEDARLTSLAVHKVGNKVRNEGFIQSNDLYELNEERGPILQDFFLKSFKSDEFFKFSHETDLKLNEVYTYCQKLFTESRLHFLDHSVSILKHLYAQSGHPNIKSGELYVAHFRECELNGQPVEAIGIFKSEHKDRFLRFEEGTDDLKMFIEQGIHTKKLDKGCLVFNTYAEDGFSVLMVDRNSEETQYWAEDFLQVQRIKDNSFQTQNYLNLARDFCDHVLAEDQDRKEQVLFLNKSIQYFAKAESYDIDAYRAEVIEKPEIRQKFDQYQALYHAEREMEENQAFAISRYAVNQMKKHFKTIIKLDTGVQIVLPAKRVEEAADYVERAYDEQRGMYYYKVYYHKEEY